MIRPVLLAAAALGACALAGCGRQPSTQIGLVDIPRLVQYWPKFQNYQNQLMSDQIALSHGPGSATDKQRKAAVLQQRYVQMESEVAQDVFEAAKQVAADKHLAYVLTRQYVGYGGVDITPDVEKALHITESSPKP